MKKPKANKKRVVKKVNSSKIPKQKNKKQIDSRVWILIGIIVFLSLAVLFNIFSNINGNVITGMPAAEVKTLTPEEGNWDDVLTQITWFNLNRDKGINPFIPNVLQGLFGDPVILPGSTSSHISAIVLTLCAWLLVFLTFSDVIRTFSSFTPGISLGIGFILATILAQFNWQVSLIIWLSKVLNITGSLLVFIGLGAAFFAFFATNAGLSKFNQWAMNRKSMMAAGIIKNQGNIYAAGMDVMKQVGEKALTDSKSSQQAVAAAANKPYKNWFRGGWNKGKKRQADGSYA